MRLANKQLAPSLYPSLTARRLHRVKIRASSENPWSDPIKKASGFVQKLKADLPIIGLISKLTTPEGIQDESGMSYQEFSRSIYDAVSRDLNATCFDIQEKYGTPGQLRYMLCILWMARYSFGSIPPKSIVQSAVRLRGSRDLEYEVTQFEGLREEEKQKYAYGEVIDYTPKNFVPTAVDGLVRLVLGITEDKEVPSEAQEVLTNLIANVFPKTRRVDIEDAFSSRKGRSYLYT